MGSSVSTIEYFRSRVNELLRVNDPEHLPDDPDIRKLVEEMNQLYDTIIINHLKIRDIPN